MRTKCELKDLKIKAMSRKRSVIFDNDGYDVGYLCKGKGTANQDLIGIRTKPAMDAGADTYIYTTGCGIGIGLHASKVGSVLRTKKGHLSKNLVADFTKNGTDCLRITSEYVKSLGKEFFWGMRMNDTHDAGYGGVRMPENRFKNDNPELMFGKGIKHGGVTAVDYLEEKVRKFAVDYIMDVVDNYAIDGIFLDFFRHPIFFRSNANGLVATKEEVAAMNNFMRHLKKELDIRRMADQTYYISSVRVPDSLEYCYKIGLDIETWLKDGLTDILFTASYLQLNDWTYSARLAHKYDVPVYPSLDESRVGSELPRHKRNSLRGYFGRIMNVWAAGCDGVFMFNIAGLRDRENYIEHNLSSINAGDYREGLAMTLKGKEFVNTLSKTYFVSFRGKGHVAGGAFPHNDNINIPTLNHISPILIGEGKRIDVAIRISDDIKAAIDQGKTPTVTVSIFMFGNPNSVSVSINDSALDIKASVNQHADLECEKSEYVLNAYISIGLIKTGENIFSFNTSQAMTLLDLWVDLDYP